MPPPPRLYSQVCQAPPPQQPTQRTAVTGSRPFATPVTVSPSGSDLSVRTLSSISSSSWDVISGHSTRAQTPSPGRARGALTPVTRNAVNASQYVVEREASTARIGLLMFGSECDRARRQLLAAAQPPSRRDMGRVLKMDTLRLNYYRDVFTSTVRTDAAMVQQMWQDAIRPVLSDTQLYTYHPALRCSFLHRAYVAYKELYDQVPHYQRTWLECLRDLSDALARSSRAALDQVMEKYASPECESDTVVDVAESYINVDMWRQAKRQWKCELRANELLEASLYSMQVACASSNMSGRSSARVTTPRSVD